MCINAIHGMEKHLVIWSKVQDENDMSYTSMPNASTEVASIKSVLC